MCERLGQLREAMGRFAARFEPALLSSEEAVLAVAEAAAIENMAATVKALAAVQGDCSPAHHLSRTTGTSVSQAGEVLATGRRPAALPLVAAAARAGELSASQAAAIADAASLDARAEARLVAKPGPRP